MSEGKFFFIRSQLSSLVLDVQDQIACDGQPVTTFDYNGGDNQLWFADSINNVIRSKLDPGFVLMIKDESLVISPYQPGEYYQQWKPAGDRIQHAETSNIVFDIADMCEDPGARVTSYEFNGGPNQLWDITYLPPVYGFIVSKMHGKVLDVDDSGTDPGTKVLIWKKHSDQLADNQMWYEDKYGYIKSKLNDYTISSTEGSARLYPYDPDLPGRQWVMAGKKIANRTNPGQVLEIRGGSSWNGAKLDTAEYTGAQEQLFQFEYV